MDAAGRESFEKQLAADEELREIYAYTLRVARVVKDRNEKFAKMEQWKAEHPQERRSFHNTLAGRIVYAAVAAAAVVAVVFMVNRRPSMPEFNALGYECYRGACSVQHVANLISEEKYENAIYVIEREEKEYLSDTDSLDRLVPTATPQQAECIRYQKEAGRLDYDELRWLKVYALEGLGRYDDADSLLKEISSGKGKYSSQADSLLNR